MGRITSFVIGACLILASLGQAQVSTPSPSPGKVFPLLNAKMTTNLNANGFQITNLDTSNLILGSGTYQPLNAGLTLISLTGVTNFGAGLLNKTSTTDLFNYVGFAPPQDLPRVPNYFLSGYSALTGHWTVDQPDFSEFTGHATIAQGGTNAITANDGLNNLLPDQTANAAKILQTDGTNATWQSPTLAAGTAKAIATLTSHSISNLVDPTSNQVLTYDSTNHWWYPANVTSAATGTVTSVKAENLAPLFTTNVTNGSTTPDIVFTASTAAAHTVYGNPTVITGTPSFYSLTLSAIEGSGQLPVWATKVPPTGVVLGTSDVQTVTGKTIDGLTNTIKTKKYIDLTKPARIGSGSSLISDVHSSYNYECRFDNAQPASGNWAEYHLTVPPDLDGSIDLKFTFKFVNYLSNSTAQSYIFSVADIPNSGNIETSPGSQVFVQFFGDQQGDSGDIETLTGTLTGWRGVLKPGDLAVVRVARDGNSIGDPSTIDSITASLQIEYGSTQ